MENNPQVLKSCVHVLKGSIFMNRSMMPLDPEANEHLVSAHTKSSKVLAVRACNIFNTAHTGWSHNLRPRSSRTVPLSFFKCKASDYSTPVSLSIFGLPSSELSLLKKAEAIMMLGSQSGTHGHGT